MNTPLADYYHALKAMKEQELCALAEAHAEDSTLLRNRFLESVEAVEARPGIDIAFHGSKRKDPASVKGVDVKRTIQFIKRVCEEPSCAVGAQQSLAFRYIDHEIFPARKTAKEAREPRHSLDLLLANSNDNWPVFAEVKIGGDKPTYFALIQILMLAAEFQSPSQRKRLKKYYPKLEVSRSAEGPFADLYIMGYASPKTGEYRARSATASETISQHLMADARFAQYIRRIVYLEASTETGPMTFEKRFAFGAGL